MAEVNEKRTEKKEKDYSYEQNMIEAFKANTDKGDLRQYARLFGTPIKKANPGNKIQFLNFIRYQEKSYEGCFIWRERYEARSFCFGLLGLTKGESGNTPLEDILSRHYYHPRSDSEKKEIVYLMQTDMKSVGILVRRMAHIIRALSKSEQQSICVEKLMRDLTYWNRGTRETWTRVIAAYHEDNEKNNNNECEEKL